MKKLLSVFILTFTLAFLPIVAGATEIYWEAELDKLTEWQGTSITKAADWEASPMGKLGIINSGSQASVAAVQYTTAPGKITMTKGVDPYAGSSWQVGINFKIDKKIENIFSEENKGIYVYELKLGINQLEIDNTNGNSMYLFVGSDGGWPGINTFKPFKNGFTNDKNTLAAYPLNKDDVVTLYFQLDTANKQTTVIAEKNGEQTTLYNKIAMQFHNTSSQYQVNNLNSFLLAIHNVAPKGTSFDILDFKVYKNPAPPVVSADSIKLYGEAYAGKTLTVQYDYEDSAKEKNSVIEWYTADDENGTNPVTVKTETYSEDDDISKLQYVIDSSDVGKYLFVKITPKSAARVEPDVSVGEPVEKMLSYIGTVSDMPKVGDIKEINGKQYYVAQAYNFEDSELPKGINVVTSGDAQYAVNNGVLEFTKTNADDKTEAYIRMFEHDGSYAPIKADEILVGADITVNSENGKPLFEFNTIDNNSVKIAGGGYMTDAEGVDKFYVNYADKKGVLQSADENYFDGIEKSVLMKMDFINQQVAYDVNSLEKLAPDYSINAFQDLYGFSMKFANGENSTGTVKVDNLYVYIPLDNLLDTAFDAFCSFADFSDTEVNTVTGDVTLPYTSFLNTVLEWESSDPAVISSNGTAGVFTEDKEVTLTAKLTCSAIANDSRTKEFKFILLSDMGENLLSDAQLSGSTNGGKVTAAADNDLNTSWSSASNDTEPYLQYNIKAVKPINTVRLYGKNIGSITVQTSADGNTFKEAATVLATDETKVIADFLVEEAQYVKVLLTAKDAALPVEISESGIYFEPDWTDKILLDYSHPKVDIPYMPTGDLTLPTVGTYGSTITWSSEFPAILSSDGTITKPTTDTLVTLTAVISAPDGSAEPKTLTYKVLIEGAPATSLPGGSNTPLWGGNGGGGGGSSVSGGSTVTTPATPVTPAESFNDLGEAAWAKDYINDLYEKKIISGYPDGTFRPNGQITREEFVKIAVEAFGIEFSEEIALPFDDATENDWCYGYIKTAYGAGIIKGTSETAFGVGQPISRQDMAVILSNIIKITEKTFEKGEKTEFNDEESFADYAKEAISELSEYGILNGDENGSFNPSAQATRAESCKVICVMISEA